MSEEVKRVLETCVFNTTSGAVEAVINGKEIDVARIYYQKRLCSFEQSDAIGRLFAAAPDLLAACELAQIWLANCVPVTKLDLPMPLPVIAAATAKAREGK